MIKRKILLSVIFISLVIFKGFAEITNNLLENIHLQMCTHYVEEGKVPCTAEMEKASRIHIPWYG